LPLQGVRKSLMLVDGVGFEPTASAMPTPKDLGSFQVKEQILGDFEQFMKVNMRLCPATVQHTIQDIRRFVESSKFTVNYENISKYLNLYVEKAPKTYNQQITSLRRFVKDFLSKPELIASFKMAPIDEISEPNDLSKAQVRKGFIAQQDILSKATYLFTTVSCLRKGEILSLTKDRIDFKNRAIIPQHYTRVKRSGVTFYNNEAETWLNTKVMLVALV